MGIDQWLGHDGQNCRHRRPKRRPLRGGRDVEHVDVECAPLEDDYRPELNDLYPSPNDRRAHAPRLSARSGLLWARPRPAKACTMVSDQSRTAAASVLPNKAFHHRNDEHHRGRHEGHGQDTA